MELNDNHYIIIFDDNLDILFGYKVGGYPTLQDMMIILKYIEDSGKPHSETSKLHFSIISEEEYESINQSKEIK